MNLGDLRPLTRWSVSRITAAEGADKAQGIQDRIAAAEGADKAQGIQDRE
jgi:hypothetical protein